MINVLGAILDWFGFGATRAERGLHQSGHDASGHGHTHGVVDPTIATTETGIWAVKWSFVVLGVTALLQAVVVYVSGSVALLADTIHNVGDATTAIPLWIAFALALRKPSKGFPYGLGRVEDLAGVVIVLIILISAVVAGYEAIDRLIHPTAVGQLGWVAVAGVVGFLGNEAVAVFRIRVGRAIASAALIADGYHARTDGLTSLAVVFGALGVWTGFPMADPLIGFLITIVIFGIVWQSGRAVFTRLLDGVEPATIDTIRHSAIHVHGVKEVFDVKARWIGHHLHADVTVATDPDSSLMIADYDGDAVRRELFDHLPALGSASVRFVPARDATAMASHHHAPAPFRVTSPLAEGLLEIVDTPEGERMRLSVARHAEGLRASVAIDRGQRTEELPLDPVGLNHHRMESRAAPEEPHEFSARLILSAAGRHEELPFQMVEPEGHRHD